jgi:hypothetical protein
MRGAMPEEPTYFLLVGVTAERCSLAGSVCSSPSSSAASDVVDDWLDELD